MYLCVCYEDVAIIIDGWADTSEKMMQQEGEYDRIEHTYIHTYIHTCTHAYVLISYSVFLT